MKNRLSSLVLSCCVFCNAMFADIKYREAFVNRSAIDLYKEPLMESDKIEDKYKYGDAIKIEFCNTFNWCKTKDGYVKQHLLQFVKNNENIPKENLLKEPLITSTITTTASSKYSNKWNETQIFTRTSVDENLKDILTAIALQNKSQIIFGKKIEGTETLTIKGMPLESAFNLILQKNDLSYKWQGNTLVVTSSKDTNIKKEFIILENLTIEKLIDLLTRYNIYASIKDKVIFDKEMNAVYIEASGEVISDFQKILTRFEMAEKLLRETRVKRTQEDIEYKRLEAINEKTKADKKKKEEFGFSEFEEWKMIVDIVALKYINVSSTEVEFQGKIIKVESLEETLKGLLGTGYVNQVLDNKNINEPKVASTRDFEKSYLKMDARTNSIIIKDYPDRIAEIKQIIAKLDMPINLIEIEVTIAAGNTGFTNQLGIALGGIQADGKRTYGLATSTGVATNLNNIQTGTTNNFLQPSGALGLSGSMLFSGAKNTINAQLNAMEEEGNGKVLSNPKIVTLNNREATIVSGRSISIPVTTNDKIGLETVDTGISIKSTPHIIEKKDDMEKDIMLDISIESSDLGDTTGGQINKTTNKINTNVIMKNGQTLILGGLFQYTQTSSNGGVPFLKDIPLLGFLFSTKNKLLNKNELVFFITPRIITSQIVDNMQNSTQMHYQKGLEENKAKFLEQMDDTIKEKKKLIETQDKIENDTILK